MTIWFVSRHSGAIDWAKQQGFVVDCWVAHLEQDSVVAGDVVIGTLPIQVVAKLCERGVRYLHLSLDIPPEWRGRELSLAELEQAGARLDEFVVSKVAWQ